MVLEGDVSNPEVPRVDNAEILVLKNELLAHIDRATTEHILMKL